MTRNHENTAAGQRGFTLVELVVVIAILGVLAAIAVPTLTSYLASSKVQGYDADRERIQLAVDSFYSDPGNARFTGLRQYPLLGMGKTNGTFYLSDGDDDPETLTIDGNPLGGTRGGSPVWIDDGNGIRDDDEEDLNDEDSPATTPGWHVAQAVRQETTYYVDSRDFFVNFEALVAKGLLDRVPKSASPDNKPPGSTLVYEGSYAWYVDDKGKVGSLFRYFPASSQAGFQEAFP